MLQKITIFISNIVRIGLSIFIGMIGLSVLIVSKNLIISVTSGLFSYLLMPGEKKLYRNIQNINQSKKIFFLILAGLVWFVSVMSLPTEETPRQDDQSDLTISSEIDITTEKQPKNTDTNSEKSSESESDKVENKTDNPKQVENKNRESATVSRVIDGDTIQLSDGRRLRYIGINTPESVAPNRPVECLSKEASNYNAQLVDGKTIYLEKDVSETDRYGRLLRYVYLEDGTMVNEALVTAGYAQASAYPPDIKHQDQFRAVQKQAQENKVGLWSDACQGKAQATKPPQKIIQPTATPFVHQPIQPTGTYNCNDNCKKTCPNLSCDEAQYQLRVCGCTARDGDGDGLACDRQCGG